MLSVQSQKFGAISLWRPGDGVSRAQAMPEMGETCRLAVHTSQVSASHGSSCILPRMMLIVPVSTATRVTSRKGFRAEGWAGLDTETIRTWPAGRRRRSRRSAVLE